MTIIGLTLLPKATFPKSQLTIPHIDKVVHFGFYFILITIYLIEGAKHKKNLGLWAGLLFSSSLGIGTEYGQLYLHNGRSYDLWDMVANMLGVCAGALVYTFILKKS